MELKDLSARVEIISQTYADAFCIERDANWFILKLQEEVGELTQSYLMRIGKARAKGRTPQEIEEAFCAEIADVLCHTLLLAHFFHIDIEQAIKAKWLSREPRSLEQLEESTLLKSDGE